MKALFQFTCILAVCGLVFACKSAPKTEEAETQTEEQSTTADASGDYNYVLEPQNSLIMWQGSKPAGKHNGTLKIKEGNLKVENGNLVGGNFVMDMTSINVTDLEGDYKAGLEGHLKGTEEGKEDDFFNIAKYPTGTFVVNKVTLLEGTPGANCMIYGDLTLKDITRSVGFKAQVDLTDNKLTGSTEQFVIDRTNWNIKFMSNKFFDNLKDEFINDEIGLSITLVANPM